MRFVSALLFVALTGGPALADEAKPADAKPEATQDVTKHKVPLRVVKMLPETRQVLLFDREKGTHVVAEAGQDIDGYTVDELDDDEVTLTAPSGAQVILTAPLRHEGKADRKAKKAGRMASATGKAVPPEAAPEDPYADPADAAAPRVAGENGVRVASASDVTAADDTASATPADPYGDPAIAAFAEAVGATPTPAPAPPSKPAAEKPATPASTDGAALGAALTGSPAPATPPSATPPAAGPTTATLKRTEVDAALADFGATASTFKATFTAQGLRFDDVAAGSLLAKVGLVKGDVVTTVDGQPLRSLDDAANLYARLPTAKGSTLVVQRAGKPVTLRISIQ